MRLNGGGKLTEALREIKRKLRGDPKLQVGFLENATYPDGTPVALVAATQNLGSRTIPARPFFSSMIKEKQSEWGPALAKLLADNGYDAEGFFSIRNIANTDPAIVAQGTSGVAFSTPPCNNVPVKPKQKSNIGRILCASFVLWAVTDPSW